MIKDYPKMWRKLKRNMKKKGVWDDGTRHLLSNPSAWLIMLTLLYLRPKDRIPENISLIRGQSLDNTTKSLNTLKDLKLITVKNYNNKRIMNVTKNGEQMTLNILKMFHDILNEKYDWSKYK